MSADHLDTRPLKRSRTQVAEEHSSPHAGAHPSTVEAPLVDFKRSAEFWFDDGSIIIVAKNTGFRVYRALLARQSPVFDNMFSSSTPNAAEMSEGCPIVHVSDSAEDVVHLLRVLLSTSQRTLFSRSFSFSFDQISAIVRLAHKYDIQDILEQAISSLQEIYPIDFDTYERDEEQVVDVAIPHSIGVVNLARLIDRPSLLPAALYSCALMGSTVLDGYEREDSSIEYLPGDDLKCAIRGRNLLSKEANRILLEVFVADPCVPCMTRAACRAALRLMLERAIANVSTSLRSWEDMIGDWGEELGLCNGCQQAAVDRDKVARRHLWNALPSIFDVHVEGWPTDGVDGGGA